MIDSITLDPSIGPNVTKLLKDTFVVKYGFAPVPSKKSSTRLVARVQKSSLYSDLKPEEIAI